MGFATITTFPSRGTDDTDFSATPSVRARPYGTAVQRHGENVSVLDTFRVCDVDYIDGEGATDEVIEVDAVLVHVCNADTQCDQQLSQRGPMGTSVVLLVNLDDMGLAVVVAVFDREHELLHIFVAILRLDGADVIRRDDCCRMQPFVR